MSVRSTATITNKRGRPTRARTTAASSTKKAEKAKIATPSPSPSPSPQKTPPKSPRKNSPSRALSAESVAMIPIIGSDAEVSQIPLNFDADAIDWEPIQVSGGHKLDTEADDARNVMRLEKELLSLGYTPLQKSLMDADKKYIKAVNSKGQKVFISLDLSDQPHNKFGANGETYVLNNNIPNTVPFSVKNGILESIGNALPGVAFECGSGSVCLLTKNETMEHLEKNFVLGEMDRHHHHHSDSNSVTPYPVISLNDIRENAELVLITTDNITRKLRNNAFLEEVQSLELMSRSVQNLTESLERFNAMKNTVSLELTRTLDQLDEWNEIYRNNPPKTEQSMEKYNQLLYNLSYRNDAIDTFLVLLHKVNERRSDVDKVTTFIETITDYGEKEFANVSNAVSK